MLSRLARARPPLVIGAGLAVLCGALLGASVGRAADGGAAARGMVRVQGAAGGGPAGPGAEAARVCARLPSIGVLVDASGSMAEHDPGGVLRVGVAQALDRALEGRPLARPSRVVAFAGGALGRRSTPAGGIGAAVRGLLAAGDEGTTDLAAAMRSVGVGSDAAAPSVVVVLTDGESAEPVRVPDGLRAARFVVGVVGGDPPASLIALAASTGGSALALHGAAEAGQLAAVAAGLPTVGAAAPAPAGRPGGAGLPCAPRSEAPGPTASRAPVVLLSGLRDRAGEVDGATRASACSPALSLAAWCRMLVAAGRVVWVPPIGPGGQAPGGARAVLDSTGRLRPNASRLAAWLRGHVGHPAVFVGHSMGGLVARAAITWDAAPAAGLVTVGTPHTGSFGADAYLAALSGAAACRLSCPFTAAGLLVAAAGVRARFGDALDDLTRRRRAAEPLGAMNPSTPVAAYAGAVNDGPGAWRALRGAGAPGRADGRGSGGVGYLVPNDGIVGVSSALGIGTLGPLAAQRADGAARHSSRVPPRTAPTQLGSAETARFVVDAVARVGGEPSAAGARASGRRPSHVSPRRLSAPLAPVLALDDLAPGTVLPTLPDLVVSVRPIGLLCDGTQVAALEVSADLFFLDLAALGCGSVGIARSGLATTPLGLATAGAVALGRPPANGARLTLLRRSTGAWRIRASGLSELPQVRLGSRAIAMRAVAPAGAVPRELPPRARAEGVYQGAIGRRNARRGGTVTARGTGPDGAVLAAALELG